jgi:hypothetical protein
MVFPQCRRTSHGIVIRKKLPIPLPIKYYVEAKVLPRAFMRLFKLFIRELKERF